MDARVRLVLGPAGGRTRGPEHDDPIWLSPVGHPAMKQLSRAFGTWEFGLLVFMAVLYLVGTWINPNFFGNATALASVLRDAARFGVMAVGMSFVIINRDLDLSIGSTLGLVSVVFAITIGPTFYDLSPWIGVVTAVITGLAVGLVNGVLVTYLRVPAFIATLTMLFIGRGLVLGLTGGQNIGFAAKDSSVFFIVGATNSLGFNNQVIVFALVAILGGFVLARTRWATRPTPPAGMRSRPAMPASIPTSCASVPSSCRRFAPRSPAS